MHPAVMICDCGFEFVPENAHRPKIYSLELRSEWAGSRTPDDAKQRELDRLRKLALDRGFGFSFVARSYKKLFGEAPELSDAEKRNAYEHDLAFAKEKGYKRGWAAYRFKSMFSHWPNYG
jgi:hypothetical protein